MSEGTGWPCWVRCEVSLGFFPSEYAIVMGADVHHNGFIDMEHVRTELPPTTGGPIGGEAEGVVLQEDDTHCLVRLPWKSFEQEQVRVPKGEVFPR